MGRDDGRGVRGALHSAASTKAPPGATGRSLASLMTMPSTSPSTAPTAIAAALVAARRPRTLTGPGKRAPGKGRARNARAFVRTGPFSGAEIGGLWALSDVDVGFRAALPARTRKEGTMATLIELRCEIDARMQRGASF